MRVTHREVLGIDPHPDRRRIGVEVLAHQIDVADRGSHENVSLAAARDEEAHDILPRAHEVLRRRGLVVDIARVDVGAVVE